MSISSKLEAIRAEFSRFRNADLIAVSKFHSVENILEAYAAGQRDFGENYVQELLEKDARLRERGIEDIRWHFIGHLQSNKVKQLLPIVSVIHTVDSVKLANEISKRWHALGRAGPLPMFLEVNVDREESKAGFDPDSLLAALPELQALPGLDWRGLMCIPSPEGGVSGQSFRHLVELEGRCRPMTQGELSMGMSEDYVVALREGEAASKVWVRIGTGIFGRRPSP